VPSRLKPAFGTVLPPAMLVPQVLMTLLRKLLPLPSVPLPIFAHVEAALPPLGAARKRPILLTSVVVILTEPLLASRDAILTEPLLIWTEPLLASHAAIWTEPLLSSRAGILTEPLLIWTEPLLASRAAMWTEPLLSSRAAIWTERLPL